MANGQPSPAEKPVQIPEVAEAVAGKLLDPLFGARLTKIAEQAIVEAIKTGLGSVLRAAAEIGATLAEGIVEAEEIADPAFQRLLRVAFKDITGVDLGGGAPGAGGREGRAGAAKSLGGALFTAIAGTGGGTGAGGTLEPSQRGAEDYLTWVTQMALEGWLTGVLGEVVSLGQVEALGDLDDALAETLGLGRMSRRVVGPLLNAKVVTPFQWHVNRLYRPELLSSGDVVRQVTRGRWTREQGFEELARQGFSDTRIEALFNAQRRFSSPSDVRTFVYYGYWTNDQAQQHLRDQGYDEQGAVDALRIEGLKRNAAHEDAVASVIVNAYAARDIDDLTFRGLLGDVVTNQFERNFAIELGQVRRAVNVRRLSPAEARAAVKAKILAVRDYRLALEREGYPPDDVLVLELLLRAELDAAAEAEELRRQALAERAAEKAARDEERARRAAELAADRAADRRGPTNALETAAIRGLVPIDRVAELYAQDYDDDAVAILLELLEDKRQDYITAQQRRAEAEQRANRRGLSVGDLRAAVLAKTLTIEEFAAQLRTMELPDADVAILVNTLRVQVAERDDAIAKRREAEIAARRRRIDLPRFERLVRRGARSLEQYDALLVELGFDEGSIAAMRELLELTIADDTAAREAREQKDAEQRDKGPTVTQFMRGVLLGVKTPAEYSTFLIDQGFNVDAQLILMAELRAELDEAEAARRRREAETGAPGDRALPLSSVRRAAQLGVVSPDAYVARLQREGYSDDDVDLELDLLLLEIAEVQQQRAARDAAIAAAGDRGLSVADAERAVRSGVAHMNTYRSALAEAGYSVDASNTLIALLERELVQLTDARAREATIEGELAAKSLSLAQLKESVTKGFNSLDDFYAEVLALGYGSDDAELLTALLAVDLEKTTGGA